MAKFNNARNGCKDVFRLKLIESAKFEGKLEIPTLEIENSIPRRLTRFSECLRSKDFDSWIHFYEDDVKFERIWNRPDRYLDVLRKFSGVITPDFSLYRDMPLVMQYWNIYRSRAIGSWLQQNGLNIIPNIRWGDERTWQIACLGIPINSTIAIGSHGCIRCNDDRYCFTEGLKYVTRKLKPKTIIVYGSTPDAIFSKYHNQGITIRQFDSAFSISRKAGDA